MIYQIEKILEDVRVCLDMNQVDTALLIDSDEDTLRLNELIHSKIVDAVRRVHQEAPYWKLEQGHNFEDDEAVALYWKNNDTCGWILLPGDFMRLVVFEMDDWERPVYELVTPDNPRYAMQSSRVKGVRGTPQKPVCVLGVRPAGRVLEFYSCKSQEARVRRGVYIPYPKIESVDIESVGVVPGIDISKQCYDNVKYYIAGLTLETLGDMDKAKMMFELGKG